MNGIVRLCSVWLIGSAIVGCGDEKQPEQTDLTVVQADGIVGETVRVTGQFTAKKKQTITRAVSNCGCTLVTLSKRDIQPGDRVSVSLEFDTAGKAPQVHRLPVYGIAPASEQPITLPVVFDVSLEGDIVFDDRLLLLKRHEDSSEFAATVAVNSKFEITGDDVEVMGLPVDCQFRWDQQNPRGHNRPGNQSTVEIVWTPGARSSARVDQGFTLRSQVVDDQVDVSVSLIESAEVAPSVAGEFVMTLSCRLDDRPVSCSVPVLYTLAGQAPKTQR